MTLLTRFLQCLSIFTALVQGQVARAAYGQEVIDDGSGTKTVSLRTHVLFPPYLDSDLQSRWFPNQLSCN